MSDLPAIEAGKSWWAGLADIHKPNPNEQLDEGGLGAYCWIAVPAASETEAIQVMKSAAKGEGLVVEDIEDVTKVSSLAELRELDDYLANAIAGKTSVVWGELNPYTAEEEAA